MIERLIIVGIIAFMLGIGNGYMYYTNIAPKLNEIIEMLREKGEKE